MNCYHLMAERAEWSCFTLDSCNTPRLHGAASPVQVVDVGDECRVVLRYFDRLGEISARCASFLPRPIFIPERCLAL